MQPYDFLANEPLRRTALKPSEGRGSGWLPVAIILDSQIGLLSLLFCIPSFTLLVCGYAPHIEPQYLWIVTVTHKNGTSMQMELDAMCSEESLAQTICQVSSSLFTKVACAEEDGIWGRIAAEHVDRSPDSVVPADRNGFGAPVKIWSKCTTSISKDIGTSHATPFRFIARSSGSSELPLRTVDAKSLQRCVCRNMACSIREWGSLPSNFSPALALDK